MRGADIHEDLLNQPACNETIPSRTRKPLLYGQLVFVCLVLAMGLSGCIFAPDKAKPCTDCSPPPPVYPKLNTPEAVMAALEMAYEARDSVEIKVIYDGDYLGTSIDQSNPTSIETLSFTRQQEIDHVARLFLTRSITSIALDFPPVLVREPGDAPGWIKFTLPPGTVRLEINDNPTVYQIISTNSTFEFSFIPIPPDSGSTDTTTTYKIIRWTEIRL